MLPGTLLPRRRVSVVLLITAMVGLLLPHHTVAFHFRPRYWRSAAGTRIDWSLLASSAGRGGENTQTGSHQTTTLQESQPTGTFDDAAGEGDDLADIERELWLEDEKELQMSADMHVDDTTAAITTVSTTGNDNDNDEPDINLVAETEMDRSIVNAVKSLLDEGPKEPELSPVEKFNQMYKGIKSRSKDSKTPVQLDSAAMLADLFSDSQKKDPFDEKQVMMKLRKMLEDEDFQDLFKDPNVGDIY